MKKCNYLTLIFLIISVVSCGNLSKKELNSEQLNFCENFFIALQLKEVVNNDKYSFYKIKTEEDLDAVMSLLSAVKSAGYDDVIHAFTIPEDYSYDQKEAYVESILQDLRLNQMVPHWFTGKEFNGWSIVFELVYGSNAFGNKHNSDLRLPELKTSLIEKLDNDNEIWLVQDYQSMTQARLIVKKDGSLSIGNLTALTN